MDLTRLGAQNRVVSSVRFIHDIKKSLYNKIQPKKKMVSIPRKKLGFLFKGN